MASPRPPLRQRLRLALLGPAGRRCLYQQMRPPARRLRDLQHRPRSVGEPLPVHVIHQVRPPPVESLQVRCEGRCATLRWTILDLGLN